MKEQNGTGGLFTAMGANDALFTATEVVYCLEIEVPIATWT
jgi:hypothetical protein